MAKSYTECEIYEIRALLGVIINQMNILSYCQDKDAQGISFQTELIVTVLLNKIPDPASL
ncbi:hypothetical protein LWM68_41235 [Niabella sp. W65]|nr:hypothetical protein [Niabella sp. W65]MCH7368597.1 hypothetical protein [Niabella sp. W65]ULT44184.1 hypothetical protein KRR40_12935 [Niabella sp. I65]